MGIAFILVVAGGCIVPLVLVARARGVSFGKCVGWAAVGGAVVAVGLVGTLLLSVDYRSNPEAAGWFLMGVLLALPVPAFLIGAFWGASLAVATHGAPGAVRYGLWGAVAGAGAGAALAMAGWGPDTEWFPASVVLLAAPTAVAGYIVGAVQRHLSRHGAPPAEIAASVAAGAFYFLAGTAALVLAAGALIPLPRALAWEVTALAAAFGAPAGGAVGSWGGSWIARARRRGSPAPGAALAGAIVLGAALPHVLLALPTRCFEPAPAPAVAMAALALVGLGAALGALAAERAVGATAGARGMAMGLAAGAALLLLALAGGRMPALRFHLTPASTLAARHDVAGLQRRMRDPDGLASAQAHACFAPLLSGTRDRADVQLLLSELRSPRPDHQMAAAQGLGRIGDRSVVQPLLELGGRSKDGTVLKAVATALGQLADRRAAPFLVTLLSWQGDAYQTPQVRAEAAAALERLEAPSDPAVRAGLAAYRRDLWLAEGFARDEPMPPELRGDPTVVDALIGKLRTDPNSPSESWKRSHVVKTLGGLRSPKIVPALRPLVTDPDILVRQAAFDVLVERDVETCLAAMAREDGERRHAAVRTAANFRDARIAPALLKLLDDPALREQAAEALVARGPGAPGQALASLAARKDLKDETRAKAVAGLAARRDEPTAELLAELAVDETLLERMRIGAVRALRDRNDDRAVEPLLTRARQAREGSQFPDWPRCATLKALGATGDPRAFDLARELALDRRGTVSWDVQDAALQAIALTKDPRALPLLLKLLGGEGQPPPNQIVRVGAATALGILGDRRALPPLKAATQSTVYYEYNFNGQRGRVHLRDAAAGAIRAIG